jgi:tetratricopeptide (TPR) repeat protein
MMGRYEDALQELKRASEIVEDAVILEHLGDVYIKLDDLGRAKDAYDRALEFEPDNKELRRKLHKFK